MTDVPTILAGLKTRLATVPNQRAHDVWPGTLNPPASCPIPVNTEVENTFGGSQRYEFDLILIGGPMQNDYERSQRTLYALMPLVKPAILADEHLGGICDYIIVGPWEEPGEITINAKPYFGCKRRIEVVD